MGGGLIIGVLSVSSITPIEDESEMTVRLPWLFSRVKQDEFEARSIEIPEKARLKHESPLQFCSKSEFVVHAWEE